MKFGIQHLFATIIVLAASTALMAQTTTGGIKGRVKGAEGENLGGATVTARRNGADTKSVKTDRRGSFRLDGLEPGKYNFVFEMNGYTPGIRYDIEIQAGEPRDLGDRLILSKDESNVVFLRGSVFDRNGKSLQGARVEVHRVSSDGRKRLLSSSYSNYSGEFAFRQTDGNALYSVTASLSGKSATKEVRVDSAGIHRVSITLDLER